MKYNDKCACNYNYLCDNCTSKYMWNQCSYPCMGPQGPPGDAGKMQPGAYYYGTILAETLYPVGSLLHFNSGSVIYGSPSFIINGDNTVITIPETGYYLVSYVVYGDGPGRDVPGVALKLNGEIIEGSEVLGTASTTSYIYIDNTNMVNTMLINVNYTNSSLSIVVTAQVGAHINNGYNRLTIIKVF